MPTAHLVIVGPYRYVRNPMYEAVLAIILGQALLFASWATVLYAGLVFLAVLLFVRFYEEPTLEQRVRRRVPRVPAERAGLDAAGSTLERSRLTSVASRPEHRLHYARAMPAMWVLNGRNGLCRR